MLKFELTTEQEQKFRNWLAEHNKSCQAGINFSDPLFNTRLAFTFIPSNMGNLLKVECLCGGGIDINPINQ